MATRLTTTQTVKADVLTSIKKYQKEAKQRSVGKPPLRVSYSSLTARIILTRMMPKKMLKEEEFKSLIVNRLQELKRNKKITELDEKIFLSNLAKRVEEA